MVVDTGSSDGTLALAQQLGATTGQFTWVDDFSAARNYARSLSNCEWILSIDADEELARTSLEAIHQAIVRPQFGGYTLEIVSYTEDEGHASQMSHSHLRLFRNLPEIQFEGRIHEQLTASIESAGLPHKTLDGARILHHGYRPAVMETKDKAARAIEMLEREVRDSPNDGFHWFNLAAAMVVAGRWAEAEHAARMAVKLTAPNAATRFLNWQMLSQSLREQAKNEAALEACDEAERRGAAGLLTEFERASALLALNRLEDALEAADRCLELEWPVRVPGDTAIFSHRRYTLRGQILTLIGACEEAIEMFERATKARPEDPAASIGKAIALERSDRLEEALQAFLGCRTVSGIASLALNGAARTSLALNQAGQAAKFYEEAWREGPEDFDAWVGWAQACEAIGDTASIVRAYEAFAETEAITPPMLINWGRALEQSGEGQRALHCFTEAIKREPLNPTGYFNCGDLLYRMGEFEDAAHLYESGLKQAPMNAQGWFVLGNCLARLGLDDGASLAYRQALALDPRHIEARYNLGQLGSEDQAA